MAAGTDPAKRSSTMQDVIFVLVSIASFAVFALVLRGVERL